VRRASLAHLGERQARHARFVAAPERHHRARHPWRLGPRREVTVALVTPGPLQPRPGPDSLHAFLLHRLHCLAELRRRECHARASRPTSCARTDRGSAHSDRPRTGRPPAS
jgi:hypothetical protein